MTYLVGKDDDCCGIIGERLAAFFFGYFSDGCCGMLLPCVGSHPTYWYVRVDVYCICFVDGRGGGSDYSVKVSKKRRGFDGGCISMVAGILYFSLTGWVRTCLVCTLCLYIVDL